MPRDVVVYTGKIVHVPQTLEWCHENAIGIVITSGLATGMTMVIHNMWLNTNQKKLDALLSIPEGTEVDPILRDKSWTPTKGLDPRGDIEKLQGRYLSMFSSYELGESPIKCPNDIIEP